MRVKLLLVATLMAFTVQRAASQAVFADPGVSQMDITNLSGTSLNANLLPVNQVVLLKIPVFNSNQQNAVPAGSMFWKIGLGSKMVADPEFVLANAPLNQYFAWQGGMNAGQYEIVGELIAPLPPDFFGMAEFRVKPSVLGTSTITTNFLITNHNTTQILSDESPLNNFASLQYTVVNTGGPLPVNFYEVKVQKKGCNIHVTWGSQNEVNLNRFELEASTNGVNYSTVASVAAAGRQNYASQFALVDDLRATNLMVRIKAVDHDGSFMYSETKSISGLCDNKLLFNIYPNPVTDQVLMLKATSGLFNGRYNISILDLQGRLLSRREMLIQNQTQFSYDLGKISRGKYILRVALADGSQPTVLNFEKL